MANATFFTHSMLPALLLATACGGANMTSYTPAKEHTKYSADQLFAAAQDAVQKLGIKIQTADGVEHTVDTREREVAISSIPRLSYKYSFHIQTNRGILSVESRCTKNSASKESEFKDCGDERPRLVVDEQDDIVKKALELAPTEENKSYDWSNFGKNLPEEPPPDKDKDRAKEKGKPKTEKAKTAQKSDKK